MASDAIVTENLTKVYGKLTAVDHVNRKVPRSIHATSDGSRSYKGLQSLPGPGVGGRGVL